MKDFKVIIIENLLGDVAYDTDYIKSAYIIYVLLKNKTGSKTRITPQECGFDLISNYCPINEDDEMQALGLWNLLDDEKHNRKIPCVIFDDFDPDMNELNRWNTLLDELCRYTEYTKGFAIVNEHFVPLIHWLEYIESEVIEQSDWKNVFSQLTPNGFSQNNIIWHNKCDELLKSKKYQKKLTVSKSVFKNDMVIYLSIDKDFNTLSEKIDKLTSIIKSNFPYRGLTFYSDVTGDHLETELNLHSEMLYVDIKKKIGLDIKEELPESLIDLLYDTREKNISQLILLDYPTSEMTKGDWQAVKQYLEYYNIEIIIIEEELV